MRAKWSLQQIQAWWERQPWPVGANYVPSDAVNDVQMWIGETFNPDLIRRELSWAAELGMNTMRVFLPFTVWIEEGDAFLDNVDCFLDIAASCG